MRQTIAALFLIGSAAALTAPAGAEMPRWPTVDTLDALYETSDADELVAAGVLASIGAGVTHHAVADFFIETLEREPSHVLAAHALLAHCAGKANVPICSNAEYLRKAVGNAEANGAMWVAYAAATHRYAGADAALAVVRRAGKAPEYDSYILAYMALFDDLLRKHAPLLPTHHQQLVIGFSVASVLEVRMYGICQSQSGADWTAACLQLGRRIEELSSSPTRVGIGQNFQKSMLERGGDDEAANAIAQRRAELMRSLKAPNPSEYFDERDRFWYELIETQINDGELAGTNLIRERVRDLEPINRWPQPNSDDTLVEQVAEGIVVAAPVRARAADFIVAEKRVPENREVTGLTPNPEDNRGEHVRGVDVVGGQIVITFGHHSDERLHGLTLVLTPYVSDTMSLAWHCGYAPPPAGLVALGAADVTSTVPPDYVPGFCLP